MRRSALPLLFALLLIGCATTTRFYVPTDKALAQLSTSSCSGTPTGHANIPLADQRTLRLTMLPDNGTITVALQVRLLPGERLRLIDRRVTFTDKRPPFPVYAADLGSWSSVVRGPGGKVLFSTHAAVNESIAWRPSDDPSVSASAAHNFFTISTALRAPHAPLYAVTLPPMEMNNTPVPSLTFDAELREDTSMSLCVQ